MTDTTQYLCLKVGQAAKTGERSTGQITYRVLSDTDRQSLFLTLTGNDGGGWFSDEIVPLSRIEEVLDTLPDRSQSFPSKILRPAFVSKSVNNAGFLGALLRAERLLAAAPEDKQQHVLTDAWSDWKAAMLSLDGEPYDPKPKAGAGAAKPDAAVVQKEKSPEPRGKRKGTKKTRQGEQHDIEEAPAAVAANEAAEAQVDNK